MITPFNCALCGSDGAAILDSYKHRWLICADCGTVFSRRKAVYPAERILPAGFLRWTPRLFREKFYPAAPGAYDYFAEASGLDPASTKWKDVPRKTAEAMERLGASLRGRSVLDVSGGPGFVVKSLAGVARRAVVTEYSPVAVEGMRRNLGVEAVRFDYASDRLEDLFQEPFDVVLIRYSINYCTRLRSFAASLRRVVHADSRVYVTFVVPTLGCCLRQQFDDYPYLALYSPAAMRRAFEGAGFERVEERDDLVDPCTARRSVFFKALATLLPYRWAAWVPSDRLERAMVLKTVEQFYRVRVS